MGKLQAAYCVALNAQEVGESILQWLVRTPTAQTPLTEGLVKAWENVYSYANACRMFDLLGSMHGFTPVQLQRIAAAAQTNSQVRDAHYPGASGSPLPYYVDQFIAARGGTPEPRPAAADTWSTDPPF
jgi:hypothetical protein